MRLLDYSYRYYILLVNSHDYHKFQVEIGAATNGVFIMKLLVTKVHNRLGLLLIRYKFMVFNLVLRGNYLSHEYILANW